MLSIGDDCKYGIVSAIGMIEGERYYWFIDEDGIVSMIPATCAEGENDGNQKDT